MTAPVESGYDVVSGAAMFLEGHSELTDLLGSFEDTTPYLFQVELNVGTTNGTLEGSEQAAVVVSDAGTWSGANNHNTLAFPKLSVEIYVDPIRDEGGNTVEPAETYRRATAVWKVADKILHRPQGGVQVWGFVRVLSCIRLAVGAPYKVPDGDGMVRIQAYYALEEG